MKKQQHRYVIGPRGAGIQDILQLSGVSVEVPPFDSDSETVTLRGEPDKLGNALSLVYEKVRMRDLFHQVSIKSFMSISTVMGVGEAKTSSLLFLLFLYML